VLRPVKWALRPERSEVTESYPRIHLYMSPAGNLLGLLDVKRIMVSVSVYVCIIFIKNMPWSPKSTLAGHQRPGIRHFSFVEVMNLIPFFKAYLARPSQNLRKRRVHIRLARMFQRRENDLEIASIVATLARINVHRPGYAVHFYNILDEIRQELNEDRSPEASDYED